MPLNYILYSFFALSFLVRSIFVFLFPETGGDYDIYSTVAKNILRGCGVSLSDPSSYNCVPHFGGNHGPGYDFFIAIIWYFFEQSNSAVRIVQTFIYCFFCFYLLCAVRKHIEEKVFVISFGIILSLSPLLVAWPRYIQTETLSIAFTLFLISELLYSFNEKKIRVVSVSVALILATWIRLDNIFLTIPVAFCCIYLHGFRRGFLYGLYIASFLSLSWGIWTIRNISVNLPSLLPSNMIMPDGSRPPIGYLNWTKTWITQEYEKPGSLWGVNRQKYVGIFIPEYAYFDNDEKTEIQELLNELKEFNGMPFPKKIDDQFNTISEYKRNNYKIKHWIENPLKRVSKMFLNPFSSFGWPNEIPSGGLSHDERLFAYKGNLGILLSKIQMYPIRSLSKGTNAIYKFSLLALFAYSLFFSFFKSKNNLTLFFGYIALSYFLGRTVFFSFNGMFETRYLATVIPFMELLVTLCLFEKLRKKFTYF